MTDQATIRQLQRHTAEAFEVFLTANPTLGAGVERIGDAFACRWPAVPAVLFNHAVGLGDERAPDDEDIDRILEFYREPGLPCYIQLSPLADEEALGRRLQERGMQLDPPWSVLAASPSSFTPQSVDPAITVELVDGGSRDDFVRVLLEAFEMGGDLIKAAIEGMIGYPDVLCFLARYNGEPAGTGQLITKAGVGGLFSGGVLERFRRRGIHTALISERARIGFDHGLDLLYSETEGVGNQSSRDLQRLGFFEAYQHVNWSLPGQQ